MIREKGKGQRKVRKGGVERCFSRGAILGQTGKHPSTGAKKLHVKGCSRETGGGGV